ncbi:hypothetical protein L1987_32943 [Smallanthus sonchifolius]|uniref:Uncharacterized protein n=1 Tax=Smallanthus sonchifolius TaxID=185202 RepID=A0ACB9HQZ4_9ASTR|nr:hypothetical protein L1987_32943 [Smallanthus sonchifolius]
MAARNFQTKQESAWKKHFHSLSILDDQDIPYQRIVGLKIKGVPFILRDKITFDKIGQVFGRTILPSEFDWDENDNSFACCYALTDIGKRIEVEIIINWRNTSYPVWDKAVEHNHDSSGTSMDMGGGSKGVREMFLSREQDPRLEDPDIINGGGRGAIITQEAGQGNAFGFNESAGLKNSVGLTSEVEETHVSAPIRDYR